jgi:hypothetical protein
MHSQLSTNELLQMLTSITKWIYTNQRSSFLYLYPNLSQLDSTQKLWLLHVYCSLAQGFYLIKISTSLTRFPCTLFSFPTCKVRILSKTNQIVPFICLLILY